MAEEQQQPLTAAYPAPPPFYKHFTPKNVACFKELKQQASIEDQDETVEPKLDLVIPPELRCFIPPEPPSEGRCRNFGGEVDIDEKTLSLQEQGLSQLFPSPPSDTAIEKEWTLDRAGYLKKFAKSILLNYLELVGVLAVDPAQFGEKIEHLSRLFYNSHALINEYRPHQARETLILMMEQQLQRKEEEIEGINRMKEKLEDVLKQVGTIGLEQGRTTDDSGRTIDHEARKEEQKQLWDLMDEELN
ncbi:MAG: Mediator of RNA polymerase II transcription subunit 7 [Bogoriella megaspora]|nr:MAG: Mediator of RNA polymerase II transcription subunit 7 [Bogoriella megaspora]